MVSFDFIYPVNQRINLAIAKLWADGHIGLSWNTQPITLKSIPSTLQTSSYFQKAPVPDRGGTRTKTDYSKPL